MTEYVQTECETSKKSINNGNVWVEKWRPTNFDGIVLDPLNKQILKNIIKSSYFPNLLFYGPPGTGKTTTIINLVNAYQETLNQKHKGLMIHLNASDERGIDIIRNQINQFVNSKSLFNQGMKFVILDEVDYMTKNAQQALRYLLQNYTHGVRFCLICNYISRIDEGGILPEATSARTNSNTNTGRSRPRVFDSSGWMAPTKPTKRPSRSMRAVWPGCSAGWLPGRKVKSSSAPAKPNTASTSALTSKKSTASRPCAQPSGRRLPHTTPASIGSCFKPSN